LANPQIYAPGVQMWIHVPDEEVIQALIAYLKDETTTSK
jgi:cytochrome c2